MRVPEHIVSFGQSASGDSGGAVRKLFYSPRHFSVPRREYAVEDMEDSIYKKCGLALNCIPMSAEIELAEYCFGVTKEESHLIR